MSRCCVLALAALHCLTASIAAVPTAVFAHKDWCHGLHACPSDHGSYVCGDQGRCDLCPDNEYCERGASREGSAPPTVPLLKLKGIGKSGDRGGGGGGTGSGEGGTAAGSPGAKPRKPCPPVTKITGASTTAVANADCPKPKRAKSTQSRKTGGSKTDATAPSGQGDDDKK